MWNKGREGCDMQQVTKQVFISLSDVCTAKKLQDHFLSFFSASLFGFAPNSLKQFELCKKKQPFAILSILPAPT